MKAIKTFLILLIFGFQICNGQENNYLNEENLPQIINRDNTNAVKEFRKLDLDSFYDNLLDPNNVSENERQEVIESWSNFHKKIVAYLKESQFNWNSDDKSIRINKRIYFEKDGSVNYYVFKIENLKISEETKQEFLKVLKKFVAENKIDYTKDTVFAQCGIVEYNNEK